ncbi:MAG: hypothetical protein JWN73_2610 [Betaproteobacteria bacterium]|nr:hypothetical protein [Betaproteobacteria bacterium]
MGAAELIAQAYASHDSGDTPQALRLLDEGLVEAPNAPDLLFARGNVRRESGDTAGAESDFRAVIAADPAHAKAQNNLGAILLERGQWAEAQSCFEVALRADPQLADAAFNLGTALHRQGRPEEALPWLERACTWRPGFAGALLHLGQALSDLGRLEEALKAFNGSIAADPGAGAGYNDLGLLLLELNRQPEAVKAHEEAVALAPQNDVYKTNLALCLMQSGDFARAWDLYEHRWREDGKLREAYRYDPALEWRGEHLAGKRLRVWWEQGMGDTFCFSRYLTIVAQRFAPAAISLECQRGLGALMRNSLPGVEVIEQGEPGSGFDVQAPLLNLPQLCGLPERGLPAAPLALQATDAAIMRWRARVEALPGPRVGLNWSSGLWPGGYGVLRRQRNVPPEVFERLLQVPGISFVSLQKGAGAADAARWAGLPNFSDWTNELADFNDTAALMSCLDVIVTVDTSVSHLAGTLGRPTWVFLRCEGGNLWAANEERSPWYPRMRVFRQSRQAEWDEPVERAAAALGELAAAGGVAEVVT